jgi:hypothetical protein
MGAKASSLWEQLQSGRSAAGVSRLEGVAGASDGDPGILGVEAIECIRPWTVVRES